MATVDNVDPPRALIEEPGGLGFIAVVGTAVGRQRHEVVAIERGEILLKAPASRDGDSSSAIIMKLGERVRAADE